jgi:KDO2-lipid IV(A) lauroyltransferase
MSLKYRIEFALLVAVKALVNALPYRAALVLGWLLALLGFHVLRFRRTEAVRRIRSVFGNNIGGRTPDAVAWEAFRNFLFTAVESMRGETVDAGWLARYMPSDGGLFDTMARQAASGKGAIMTLPHMGSWELAGSACRVRRIALFSIAARQKNPYFNEYLNRQRSRSGIDILVRGDASLKAVLRNLKQGKCFAILPDVRMPTPALAVPFLGSTANVGAGMAMFARQADAPIFVVILTRIGWSRHEAVLHGPFRHNPDAPRDEDLLRLTREVFACFDEAIRKNPGQWFWYNKRWILDPVTEQSNS